MDNTILAVFDQVQAAEQAAQALKHHADVPGQMEAFAFDGAQTQASEHVLLERLQHFVGTGADLFGSAEKYMDELRLERMLLGVKTSQALAKHMTAQLREMGAIRVDTLGSADAQGDWPGGLVSPEDDRAFERPNREAEMENIGARHGAPLADQGERRSGEERRHMAGRRSYERDRART